jgi:hypothetical protein
MGGTAIPEVPVAHRARFLLASGAALQLRRFVGANRDVDVTIGRYG